MKNNSYRRNARSWMVTAGRFLLRGSLLAVLGGSFFLAHDSLSRDAYFELKEIRYVGGRHLDRTALNRLIRKTFPNNLLAIDLVRIRNLVEGEAWVKEALVRRKLPGALILHVQERIPAAAAAIDNELYVVDDSGVVLDSFGSRYQQLDRPIVKGLRNVAQEEARALNSRLMKLYLEVLQHLQTESRDYSRLISEIHVGNPQQVAVVPTEDPVPVVLGDREYLKRFLLFLSQQDLYRKLKEQYGEIEYVDVTYDSKIIFHTPHNTTQTVSGGKLENQS